MVRSLSISNYSVCNLRVTGLSVFAFIIYFDKHENGCFKLKGKSRDMFLHPNENDCSMCGKKHTIKKWCKHLRALGKKIKMKEFDSSNIGEDPFSEHITDSKDCFKLTGPNRTIFIHPQDNDCSLCGKKFSTKTWCDHLVSAGRKMDIPVFVRPIV